MEWEWSLPSPIDFLLHPILRRHRQRKAEELQRSARTWPTAKAQVKIAVKVRADDPPDSWRRWQTELSFSYAVNGEYYSGRALLPADTEDQVAEEVQLWRDREVVVRYRPDRVSESALLVEDQSPSL